MAFCRSKRIDGTRRLPELQLDWLEGYEKSQPVRIGIAASKQLQLDVPGEVLNGLHVARVAGLAGPSSTSCTRRSCTGLA
jgi:GH15 family glucan-1,4-alpha-glucosidase